MTGTVIEAPIKFWSFSALKTFEKCPYETYLARVVKSPRPEPKEDSPLLRGEVVHKAAEAVIKGEGEVIKELKKIAEVLEACRTAYEEGRVELEQNWFFDAEWRTTDWDNKWCYAKLDYFEHEPTMTSAHVIDWKTGKMWGKEVAHVQQGQLYAIAAFMRYPELLTVRVTFWYTDEGKSSSRVYNRTMLPQLVASFTSRANRMVTATSFPAKPNKSNCKFCSYSPNNGGTGVCSFGVEV